ncbi:hypothetical protein BC827DRAFT_1239734 [Russula dissimulans]|nr:hypothetical protein BC827DRAFT_1239734 [Russula dissimulans]
MSTDKIPLLHLKRRIGTQWEYDSNLTGVSFVQHSRMRMRLSPVLAGLHSRRTTIEYYQGTFQRFGGRGSALTVVPFNQGSKQDMEALNDHEIDGLDDESELACRIMLVNLLRLLGAVKAEPDTSRPSTIT